MFGRNNTCRDVQVYDPPALPEDTCTIWTGGLSDQFAPERACGEPAVRAVRIGCPCGHALTAMECEGHAANTDRLSAGGGATPNVCAACKREGHICPVATSPA